jgi:hypothetical protein
MKQSMNRDKVNYKELNHRQKESYNYQKIAGVLAEYGYTCYRMHDDYHGADFHAVHLNGSVLKVQLKGRITVDKIYLGKEIWIAFTNDRTTWYVYPHDKIHEIVIKHSKGAESNGARSIGYIPKWLITIMQDYAL